MTKANQAITGFVPTTPIAYSTGGTFTLSATGGASGTAIIFASTTPAICSLAGNTATILAVGTCTLTADQAGSINYNAANQVTANVTINKIDQTITGFAPATPIAYSIGGSFMLTAMGGASANPLTFASSSPLVCSVGNGVASILSVGTCTLTANQAGNATFNAAVQVTVNVVINKADQTITGFNPASPVTLAVGGAFTLSATGGASGKPVTFATTTPAICTTGGINNATVTIVTAGTCMLRANQAGDSVYNAATPVTANVVITVQAAEAMIYYVHADHLGTPRAITRPSDNAASTGSVLTFKHSRRAIALLSARICI